MFEHFSGRAQIHSQILFGKASLRLRIDALVPCRFICHKSLLSVTRLASTGSPQSPRWLANFANSFSLLSCARNRSRRARRMNFRLVSRFVSAAESGFLNRFFWEWETTAGERRSKELLQGRCLKSTKSLTESEQNFSDQERHGRQGRKRTKRSFCCICMHFLYLRLAPFNV